MPNRNIPPPTTPASLTRKHWTVLIYANGNNDLEPEMCQAMEAVSKVGSSDEVNIVMQIARAKLDLVKIIRRHYPSTVQQSWSGVRRYYFAEDTPIMINKFKNVNMADPQQLYAFLSWGIRCYPAEKYMVILGGHGYQFVGTMTDYCQKAPYIMGIPEMVTAINRAANEQSKKIDVLLLDTCYFNCIEVLYELGRHPDHAVLKAVTYINSGPLEGLQYDKAINLLKKEPTSDSDTYIKELINSLRLDLVAFAVNHRKLQQIKQNTNQLAMSYCTPSLINAGTSCNDDDQSKHELSTQLISLVIHYKKVLQPANALIWIAKKPTDNLNLISRYYRLSFAQQNHWTYYLSNRTFDITNAFAQKKSLHPIKLTPSEVYAFITIMNPVLPEKDKKEILNTLFNYQNWKRK
ncbi:MAG: peptidase clostripain [Firmicutes bacterium]|nr:peptidase clostripain [Bacillota bacterium]